MSVHLRSRVIREQLKILESLYEEGTTQTGELLNIANQISNGVSRLIGKILAQTDPVSIDLGSKVG